MIDFKCLRQANEKLLAIENAIIFNILRILKGVNPGDAYYENYLWHLKNCKSKGETFYDLYCLLWEIGAMYPRKRILEIGTRTGISMCQLLSAYEKHDEIESIVSVDPFDDGFISPAIVKANLRHLNLPSEKIEFRKGKSQDILPLLYGEGKTFDYILVDGDHTQEVAKQDLEWAHALCEKDGIIVFDDISTDPGQCGLIVVWNEFKNNRLTQYDWHEDMTGKGVAWAIKRGKEK